MNVEVEVIGKRINFIRLHDFLDRLGVEQIYSSLHTFYTALTAGIGADEEITWSGHKYTHFTLLSTMRQEDGIIHAIVFKDHPSYAYEVNIQFTSGNEIVVRVKDQAQYLQILQFLYEY